jgi:hypothetical protein
MSDITNGNHSNGFERSDFESESVKTDQFHRNTSSLHPNAKYCNYEHPKIYRELQNGASADNQPNNLDISIRQSDAEVQTEYSVNDCVALTEKLPDHWKLVPNNRNKEPNAGTEWQHKTKGKEQIIDLLKNGKCFATGVLLGAASGGLLAIDVDGLWGEKKVEELSGLPLTEALPKTFTITSGLPHRYKSLYYVPERLWGRIGSREWRKSYASGEVENNPRIAKNEGLELRWAKEGKGVQATIAGCHPKTGNYRFVTEPEDISDAPAWAINLMIEPAENFKEVRSHYDNDDKALARDILANLKPERADDRTDWVQVGMILKSVSEDLLDDWIEWSKQSSKFKSEHDCEKVWNSFNGSGLNFGTLWHFGVQDGWVAKVKPKQHDELDDSTERLTELLKLKHSKLELSRVLPEVLAHLFKEVAHEMPTAPEFILHTFLPVSASRIGTAARIIVKKSSRYIQPCIFKGGIVADSGDKKSPAQEAVIAPLRALETDANERWEEKKKQYEEELAYWESQLKSGRDLSKPEQPAPRQRFILQDTTAEAKVARHVENPRGLLIHRDELAGHFRARNKYRKGDDEQQELSEWNGSAISVDRKTESLYLGRSAISVTGGIQPGVLKELMGEHNDDAGDFARWLWCMPETPLPLIDLSSDDDQDTGLFDYLKDLYQKLGRIPEKDYYLSSGAKKYFEAFQHALVRQTRAEAHSGLKAAYAKFEAYTARLALWQHIIFEVADGADEPSDLVTEGAVLRAIEMVQYYIGQLRLIYALNAPQDELVGDLLKIQNLAERLGRPIGSREVKANINSFKQVSPEEIQKLFLKLAEEGHGEIEKTPRAIKYFSSSSSSRENSSNVGERWWNVGGMLVDSKSIDSNSSNGSSTSSSTNVGVLVQNSFPSLDTNNSFLEEGIKEKEKIAPRDSNFIIHSENHQHHQHSFQDDATARVSDENTTNIQPPTSPTSPTFKVGDRVKICNLGSKYHHKLGTVARFKSEKAPDGTKLPLADVVIDGQKRAEEFQVAWLRHFSF